MALRFPVSRLKFLVRLWWEHALRSRMKTANTGSSTFHRVHTRLFSLFLDFKPSNEQIWESQLNLLSSMSLSQAWQPITTKKSSRDFRQDGARILISSSRIPESHQKVAAAHLEWWPSDPTRKKMPCTWTVSIWATQRSVRPGCGQLPICSKKWKSRESVLLPSMETSPVLWSTLSVNQAGTSFQALLSITDSLMLLPEIIIPTLQAMIPIRGTSSMMPPSHSEGRY